MNENYKNQFKSRFYSGMMRLSLLLIALLVGFATTYAQTGKAVTVTNDKELIDAKADPQVGTISFEAGYYKYYDTFVQEGTLIFPDNTKTGNCEYFIVPNSYCWEVGVVTATGTAIAGTNNKAGQPACTTLEIGTWTISSKPAGSNVTLLAANNYNCPFIVDQPGEYELTFSWKHPESGAPLGTKVTTSFYFYTEAEITTFEADDVCGLSTEVAFEVDYGSYEYPGILVDTVFTLTGSKLPSPVVLTPVWTGNAFTLTVTDCGTYDLLVEIIGGPCGTVSESIEIKFYDEPVLTVPADKEVCALATDFVVSYTADCEEGGSANEAFTYTGPGTATITYNITNSNWDIVVDLCGEYEITYTVTNGPCEEFESFSINFTDDPDITVPADFEVCALTTDFAASYIVDCATTGTIVEDFDYTGPGTATITFVSGTTWNIEVDVCGEYEITYTVTNGPCEEFESFSINFTDDPDITVPADFEVCALTTDFNASYIVDCATTGTIVEDFDYTGPGTATITFNSGISWNIVVDVCGEYEITYTVTNGPCEEFESFSINFTDDPDITVPADFEVCALTTDFNASYIVDCATTGTIVEDFTYTGPGTATITFNSGISWNILVDVCGEYEITYTVTNGPCEEFESFSINFTDDPDITVPADFEVCALTTDFDASYIVACATTGTIVEDFTYTGPGTATITFNSGISWNILVDVCGEYEITYTVTNGPCEESESFSINFTDDPDISVPADFEVCALTTDFNASYIVACATTGTIVEDFTYTGPGTATITYNSGISWNIVVDVCGEYEITYTVTNGPCEEFESFSINFTDDPDITVPADFEVCALTTDFDASYIVACATTGTIVEDFTYTGPGTATITYNSGISWNIVVDVCGEYEITYTVTNGPCVEFESFSINFTDDPDITVPADFEVCALTTDFDASYIVACATTGTILEDFDYTGPGTATITFVSGTTWNIVVDVCGEYEITYTVTNGPCEEFESFSINFTDDPDITVPADFEVCALTTDFNASYIVACATTGTIVEDFTYTGPGTATITYNSGISWNILVDVCGEYEITYTVTNGPCEEFDSFTINFIDEPEITIDGPVEVCGLIATFEASNSVECPSGVGAPDETWTKTDGPGTWTITKTTGDEWQAEVSKCGVYTFSYTVDHGNCISVTKTIKVTFWDDPYDLYVETDLEVCGYYTEFFSGWYIDCPGEVDATVTLKDGPGTATISFTHDDFNGSGDIEVSECGVYIFTLTVENELCEETYDFSITFYEEPKFEIDGELEPTLCRAEDYTVYDLRDCTVGSVTYTWTIAPSNAGYFLENGSFIYETVTTGNASSTVTIVWEEPGTATLSVFGESIEGCDSETYIEIDPQYPKIAGQVKYWNEVETFMPTPFPTEDYATYPHDYFYVTLWNFDGFKNGADSITTVKVEPRLIQEELTPTTWNLYEYMSYFEFNLEDFIVFNQQEGTIFDFYGCEGYFISIWDGGLHYYDLAGQGINPPLAARQLGANYTYNNWGGVNAVDALAIQLMASQTDINGAPYNFDWVGPMAWTPRFGYFSHSAADVNSTNPFFNGGVTALDALTTNYRAVGLIDAFPFGAGYTVNYSPNFRVTGRMVPELTYKKTYTGDGSIIENVYTTWPKPFDYNITNLYADILIQGTPTINNPDDVPFNHMQNNYLYFTDAREHQYVSSTLSLLNHNYIKIYYLALGDLNSSHVPTSDGFKVAPVEELLAYTNEMTVTKGDVVTVPVRITRNAELGAIALNFSYNTSLIEIVDVNYEQDYYSINTEEGTLRIGWYSMSPQYFSEGDAIALINVRVIGDISVNARFFELETGTEVANVEAVTLKDITFETTALNSTLAPEELFVTNYPNPFRNTTTISYYLPKASNVQLVVYNKMGQVIETLVNGNQDAGAHKVEFGRTDLNQGIYHYKIIVVNETGATSETNSMIFIK